MTDWRQVLRTTDPDSVRMAQDRAAWMRQAVLSAAVHAVEAPGAWPMRFALAAFACAVLVLSIFGTQRPREIAPATVLPGAGPERRQIQFATPGGTRIIWEINPHFTLGETLP